MDPSSSTAPAPPAPSTEFDTRGRGRGRSRSRGGLGKYLRARGRGRGGGRPAVFRERLVLEDEQTAELDEEAARELERKFARRQLGSNVDRYAEPEPELGSDGEEIIEPEIDLSKFLERQRLEDASGPVLAPAPEDDMEDVDPTLAHITGKVRPAPDAQSRKGRVQTIEWDAALEEMSREKAVAEAHWELKGRFRASAARQRGRPAPRGAMLGRTERKQDKSYTVAPLLPEEAEKEAAKEPKVQMEDFLDDLLG